MNFQENITLENIRVCLEPLHEKHLEELSSIAIKYPNLLQYSPSAFGTTEHLKEYIQTALNARKRESRYAFAIYDKQQRRYIGSTSYGSVSIKDARLEIGWTWLDKGIQGTGLNSYSKHLLLTHAFEVLNMQRVEFRTDVRNLQSRKAIEKVGGQFEGELRSHTLMVDGHRRNTVCYSILKEEWPSAKLQIEKSFIK